MTRVPMSKSFLFLITLLPFLFLGTGCEKSEDNSPQSNAIPVLPAQLANTNWRRIATAWDTPNAAIQCSLKTVSSSWQFNESLNWQCTEVIGTSSRYFSGTLRWEGASNLYIMRFGSISPCTPFLRNDSVRMEIFLDGQAMRTTWTLLRYPYTVEHDFWVQTNTGTNSCVAGIVRTGAGEALANVPIFTEQGIWRDSVSMTDRYGFFVIQNLPTGSYQFSAKYNNNWRSVSGYHNAGTPFPILDIAFNAGTISGYVSPSYSNYGAIGTTIRTTTSNVTATVDGSGRYELRNLLPGNYTVVATLFGYETAIQSITLEDNETEIANFTLQATPKGSLQGRMSFLDSDLPIGDGRIELRSPARGNFYADESGNFMADSLPIGIYSAIAWNGSQSQTDTVDFSIAANQVTNLSIRLGSSFGSVSGYVYDRFTQTPLASILVTCDSSTEVSATNSDGRFHIDRLPVGRRLLRINHPPYIPDSLSVYIYGANQYSSYTWELEKQPISQVDSLTGHTAQISSLQFSPDNSIIASGSFDGTVKLWSAVGGNLILTLPSQHHEVTGLSFSPDGRLLAAGTWDGVILVWQVSDGALLQSLTDHTSRIQDLAFSPDGSSLASCSLSDTLFLHRVSDWSVALTIENLNSEIFRSLSFQPDGRYLATGNQYALRIWRLEDGSLLDSYSGYGDIMHCVQYSPDGAKIVTLSERYAAIHTIFLLSSISYRAMYNMNLPLSAAFSPDQSLVAVASSDGSISFWDVAHNTHYTNISTSGSAVNAIAYSPDGRSFVSGGGDGVVKVWRVN